MYGEDYECVARDVAENSLDDADGGRVRQPVGENECTYKASDAEEGTGDKNPQVFSEVVVHDAEVRVWNFEIGVCGEGDGGRCGQ